MDEKPRILAIDDNRMNLQVVEEALDDQYHLELAENGIEGLELARAFQPLVILLDVMMPGLDGYEVCRRMKLKAELRPCRIIMVSARTSLEDRLAGYDAGADDYVTKPFNDEELRTKIDFAIRARRMEQLCGATGELLMLVSWLRDSGTVPDLRRTRDCAQLLAEELRNTPYGDQVDDLFLDDLHHACVLRDVGQLSVPPSVRNKRRTMNADESEQLKQHTLVGARLLNRLAGDHPNVSLFRMASEVARSHHEHFDGTGYPDHLRGDEIPLAARILSAVDAFEEAADDDESQAHLSFTRMQDEFAKGRGTRFDPVVVNAFFNVFDRFEEAGTDDCHAGSN